MIHSFKPYCLQLDDLKTVDKAKKWYKLKGYEDIFKLMQHFDPNQSKVDHRILYEISGQRLTNDKYWDDSDEDTVSQLL